MNRSILLIFVLVLTASSLFWVKPTWSQTTPSTPEFTSRFVDNSYNIQPRYELNSFTGKYEIVEAGYNVQNKSIVITIKNQAFSSYYNENNSIVGLYFSIRVKGHFGEWYEPSSDSYIYRSDSESTVVYCGLSGNNGSNALRGDIWLGGSVGTQDGGQADIQVKALIGHFTTIYGTPSPYDWMFGGDGTPAHHNVFTGEASGWSDIQTITIPEASPSATASPTITQTPSPTSTLSPTPSQASIQGVSQAEFYIVIAVVAAAVGALSVAVVVLAGQVKKAKAGNKQ